MFTIDFRIKVNFNAVTQMIPYGLKNLSLSFPPARLAAQSVNTVQNKTMYPLFKIRKKGY